MTVQGNSIPQWIVNMVLCLLIGAYGFIFSSVIERIAKVENQIDGLNPVLIEIQKDVSSIQTNLVWIMDRNIDKNE